MFNARIITHPDASFSEDAIYIFRKQIYVKEACKCKLYIMAEARYKLYVNGVLTAAGPLKGNEKRRYYDVLEIPFACGEIIICAQVLQLKSSAEMGTHRYLTSVYRTGNIWFVAQGIDQNGVVLFDTQDGWETARDTAIHFFKPEYAFYTGLPEERCTKEKLEWKPVVHIGNMNCIFYGEPPLWTAVERTIPMLNLEPRQIFPQINQVYDYGEMTTAYVRIILRGHGRVRIMYAERYKNPETDFRAAGGGDIFGDYDLLFVDGALDFEPFWFRCFRFLQIETEEDIQIEAVILTETMYPLQVEQCYDFGNETDNCLWETSLRTLRLCMHETYEDCPYYEQLQYAMDTYLQVLYTLQVSGDSQLAKKAISDFQQSMCGEGLIGSRAPSMQIQVIPGFSLFYILMITTYYKWFHDEVLIIKNLPEIMRIFYWYQDHLNEMGLVCRSQYWHFIDWAKGWEETHGAPQNAASSSLGIESLMLCYTLDELRNVLRKIGKRELMQELENFSKKIRDNVEQWCWKKEQGLYADDETGKTYSQHMQVWAVLTGLAQGERAREVLEQSFSLESKSSFAFLYFLFRALEKAGLYEKRKEAMDTLRGLIGLGCTTIPETPTDARSECHGWGAVALYEFTAMDLGVKVTNMEQRMIRIQPYAKERDMAKGTVWTPLGQIFVAWKKDNGKMKIRCQAPIGVQVEAVWPEGEIEFIRE